MNSIDIKKLRKSLKMSRRELGIKLSRILHLDKPIFAQTIYRWENGTKPHDMFLKGLEQIKEDNLLSKS